MDSGASITAVLRLNTTQFTADINKARETLTSFRNSMSRMGENSAKIKGGIDTLVQGLSSLIPLVNKFSSLVTATTSFNKFTNGLKNMSIAVQNLSNVTNTSQVGMIRIKEIMNAWSEAARGLTVNLRSNGEALQSNTARNQQLQQQLANLRNSGDNASATLLKIARSLNSEEGAIMRVTNATTQYAVGMTNVMRSTEQLSAILSQNSIAMERNGVEKLRNMGYTGRLSAEEKLLGASEQEVTAKTNQATSSIQRQASASDRATASTNRQATASKGLGRALSSLRMIGTMVGSMIAYNFVHNLAMATTETINAKSEMNGYFQMLHYSKGQVDDFNKSLDETVKMFPRLNKYALGETISSIGVEFELTTQEMKKAMPVVSMITSEYLRAGRNVNEASLAVKDILQGEFQRLSRETGVKGDQLKEAGWSGDKKDVMGLLEALEKVGKERNWDTFVEKANSLNDIVLILQNRFSEWSADMVERIQPTIVGVFNALIDVGGIFAQAFTGIFDWLGSGSWEATATQIIGVATAFGVVSKALLMYRSGLGLVQASQMGLKASILSLITGLKGQQIAEIGVRNSILAKILGLKAETVAESGVARAIQEKTTMTKLESVEDRLNTLSSKENSVAKMENALQTKINEAELKGLIATEEADTLRKELNTAMTESNTLASLKQAGVNGGLTTTFIMLAGAENATAVATGEISVAMGVLNGVMAISPIGWITGAILALAGAFYVLSGGLDAHWDKMKTFNETLDNSDDIVKANNDHLKELADTVGTDSEEYKNASESVDTFNQKLNLSKKVVQQYKDELNILPTKLSEISSANSKGLGIDDSSLKELSEYATGLDEGYNSYYRALQVLHKQQDDYSKSDRTMVQNMQERGAEEKDILDKREQHMEHYNNFMKHSAEHNTSDDWWGGTWAGILAGVDSFQLWLDYKTEDLANWVHDFNEEFAKLPQGLEDAWNNIDWGVLGDIGGNLSKWFGDVGTSLTDSWNDLQEMWNNNIVKPITDWWNGFISLDWLGLGGDGGETGGFMKKIDIGSWIKNLFGLGDSIDFSWATDFINNNVITPLSDAWNNFISNPMEAIGGVMSATGIGGLISALLGSDGVDFSWAIDWVNVNIISPISQTLMMFVGDPVSFIGNLGFSVSGLLDGLFGTDIFTNIWNWTNTNIIAPIGNAIWSGISQIPIVGDIVALLGLLSNENIGADEKGRAIANWIGNGITSAIGQIPIIGDIARMLGLIPQEEPNAQGKGKGIGDAIKDGVMNGMSNLGSQIVQEFNDALGGIGKLGEEAFNTAKGWADQLWQGVNSILQRHSPGFCHDQIKLEFGTDIPNAINESSSTAYSTAQSYAQNMYAGMSSVNATGFGLGTVVDEYQNDAQIVTDSSQMMGTTTTDAFNTMTVSVNQSTSQMSGNVASSYSSMQQKQQSSLNSMKTQNLQAYNDMYLKSNQSLLQMRDSTTNVTHQMTNAWSHMKDQIVASANRLKSDSTSHFNQLSNTIGGFYRKIQNPSNWGAGHGTTNVRGARNSTVGRGFARGISTRTAVKHGSGSSSLYNGRSEMTVGALKRMICPNGDCGTLFDGYSLTDKVNVEDFIASIEGEHGFGWGDWHGTHFNHIKNTSDAWSMKSPVINLVGGIDTNSSFKVGDFEKGTPNISFSSFVSMAESIFSRIPYKYYYDSAWKGSWLGALQAGACNCSDGADALIAFAQTCNPNWSVSKQHGYWGKDGHFWAVINGKVMDTTAWQGNYGWTSPKVRGYGSPNIRRANPSRDETHTGKTVNVNIEITGTVYGVDDLDDKIQESVQKGLREEFNDPYTVTI